MDKEGLKLKYFVLNPTSKDKIHALASCYAILEYADKIYSTNPQLAKDLSDWMKRVLKDLGEKKDG